MVQATLYATEYTKKKPYWTLWEPFFINEILGILLVIQQSEARTCI